MSKLFRQLFGQEMSVVTTDEMREFCRRPGKVDENGNSIYTTEQNHKKECDVNSIIKKYDKTGLITHVSTMEAVFGDVGGFDFKKAMDLVVNAQAMFDRLPSGIRKRFHNSPEEFLRFMEEPNNRDEAIKLGLIKASWTPETDGLGEHFKSDADRETVQPEPPVPD